VTPAGRANERRWTLSPPPSVSSPPDHSPKALGEGLGDGKVEFPVFGSDKEAFPFVPVEQVRPLAAVL
jgi:hypothetical protein